MYGFLGAKLSFGVSQCSRKCQRLCESTEHLNGLFFWIYIVISETLNLNKRVLNDTLGFEKHELATALGILLTKLKLLYNNYNGRLTEKH